jgi:hypothetical protein
MCHFTGRTWNMEQLRYINCVTHNSTIFKLYKSAGFPPRRPGFEPGSGHVGFCDGQKWRWGRFSPITSVSPAQSTFHLLLQNLLH